MKLNHYVLATIGILTALSVTSIHHLIDDAPLFWLGVCLVSNFSIGFVFGVFIEDK
jgi:hypothetical protein